jgi:hypothetical protein
MKPTRHNRPRVTHIPGLVAPWRVTFNPGISIHFVTFTGAVRFAARMK